MNNPCEGCHDKTEPVRGRAYKQYEAYDCVGQIPENIETTEWACGPYAEYLGYQEGLKQAESLVHQREREIVAHFQCLFETSFSAKSVDYALWARTELIEWLGLEGK